MFICAFVFDFLIVFIVFEFVQSTNRCSWSTPITVHRRQKWVMIMLAPRVETISFGRCRNCYHSLHIHVYGIHNNKIERKKSPWLSDMAKELNTHTQHIRTMAWTRAMKRFFVQISVLLTILSFHVSYLRVYLFVSHYSWFDFFSVSRHNFDCARERVCVLCALQWRKLNRSKHLDTILSSSRLLCELVKLFEVN